MSTRTIRSGQLARLDPNDKPVLAFDFGEEALNAGVLIDTYVLTITVIRQADVLLTLTKDNDSLLSDGQTVQFRLLATTASLGDKYEVACKIVTLESPAQQFERSFFVLIENQ